MLISDKSLRRLLREALLLEGQSVPDRVKTRSGHEVPYGSQRHINDLTDSMDELIRIRNAQPRRSASRYVYARAVEQMRKQLRAVERYAIRNGLIQEPM